MGPRSACVAFVHGGRVGVHSRTSSLRGSGHSPRVVHARLRIHALFSHRHEADEVARCECRSGPHCTLGDEHGALASLGAACWRFWMRVSCRHGVAGHTRVVGRVCCQQRRLRRVGSCYRCRLWRVLWGCVPVVGAGVVHLRRLLQLPMAASPARERPPGAATGDSPRARTC